MNTELTFLGRGWSFPPTFNDKRAVTMVAYEEDIVQSLKILLSTRPGERVMLPRYGCSLDVLLFEPITTSSIAYVKDLIKTAVLYYEPRIEVEAISINTVDVDDGLIMIELSYVILATNSRFNLVYPFYINEGSIV
ncbi:MAG: GPW/gp25 family protein [Bacteroidota bacterium]